MLGRRPRDGRFEEAKQKLDLIHPILPGMERLAAVIHASSGDSQEAVQELEKAVPASSRNPFDHQWKGQMLQELNRLIEQGAAARLPKAASLGVEPLRVSPVMKEAVTRLVRQVSRPPEAAALGAGTLREIFFHALQDTHGRVLLSLTQLSRPEARIADLLRRVEARGDKACTVDAMARDAGMSPASLHRHFKCVTGYPPLQYFKRQKLMRARQLLTSGGNSVSQAAHAVGYISAAQFSRDYRKLFGYPPSLTRAT